MINWNYNPEDYEEKTFSIVPVGDHRCRISSIEEKKASTGKDMLVLELQISGYSSKVWYNLVFDPADPKITNQKIGDVHNSFDLKNTGMNHQAWIGAVGACRIKHELYNGSNRANVAYFLNRDKQSNLPAWKESGSAKANTVSGGFEQITAADDLPFN